MDIATIINLVLIGALVLFALLGFFGGLAKGVKKSSLRFFIFLIFALVAGIISQFVSLALLGIEVPFNGVTLTIEEHLLQYIQTNEVTASIFNSSPVFSQIITRLPLIIINLVVFVVLLWALALIGWIVYKIVSAIIFKKQAVRKIDEEKTKVEEKLPKEKKYRWWGSLIGAAEGVLLLILTLIPFTGALSIVTDITNSTENIAIAAEEGEPSYASKLLTENLPPEFMEVLNGYNNSFFGKIMNFTRADDFIFDALTTIRVGDQNIKITLRKEIYTVVNVYNNLGFLTEIDFDEGVVIEDILTEDNIEKIEDAIDDIFDSGLIKSILPDTLEWLATDTIDENSILSLDIPEEIKPFIRTWLKQVKYHGNMLNILEEDIRALLQVVKLFVVPVTVTYPVEDDLLPASMSLYTEIMNKNFVNISDILNVKKPTDPTKRYIIDGVITNLFNSPTLQVILVEGLNLGLNELEKVQEGYVSTTDYIRRIELFRGPDGGPYTLNVNWDNVKSGFSTIINNLIDIFAEITGIENFDFNNAEFKQLINVNINTVTSKLASVLSNVQNSALLVDIDGAKTIYADIIDVLVNTEISDYVEISEFRDDDIWAAELASIQLALNALKNCKTDTDVAILDLIGTEEEVDVDALLSALTEIDAEAGNSETYIHNIISSGLSSVGFRKLFSTTLIEMINGLNDDLDATLGTITPIPEIPSDAVIYTQSEEIIDVISALAEVYFVVDESFDSEAILNNHQEIGGLMNALKVNKFRDEDENGIPDNNGVFAGTYDALVNFLKSDATYGDLITTMINEQGEENVIWTNLLLIVVNTINGELETVLSTTIDDVSYSTDITSQADEIVDVINAFAQVYDNIETEFNVNTILNDPLLRADIATLLNALKINALRTGDAGVFAGTYSAIINYLKADATYGTEFTTLIEEYEDQNDVIWTDLLALALETQSLTDVSDIYLTPLEGQLVALINVMHNGDTEYGDILADLIGIAVDFDVIDEISLGLNNINGALGTLANGLGTDVQYSTAKVDAVIAFLEGLSGGDIPDSLTGITDYAAEGLKVYNAETAYDTFDTTPDLSNAQALIDQLAQSNILLEILDENNVVVEIESLIYSDVNNYITTNYEDPIESILLSIFVEDVI